MDDKVRRLIDETNDRLRMLNKQEDDYPAWIVDYGFLERGLIQGNKWYGAENEEQKKALKDDTWAYGVLTGSIKDNNDELNALKQLDKRTLFIVFFDYVFSSEDDEALNFDTVMPLKKMRELESMGFGTAREAAIYEFFKSLPQDYQLVNMPYFTIRWTFDYRG